MDTSLFLINISSEFTCMYRVINRLDRSCSLEFSLVFDLFLFFFFSFRRCEQRDKSVFGTLAKKKIKNKSKMKERGTRKGEGRGGKGREGKGREGEQEIKKI